MRALLPTMSAFLVAILLLQCVSAGSYDTIYLDASAGVDQAGCGASTGAAACATVKYAVDNEAGSYDILLLEPSTPYLEGLIDISSLSGLTIQSSTEHVTATIVFDRGVPGPTPPDDVFLNVGGNTEAFVTDIRFEAGIQGDTTTYGGGCILALSGSTLNMTRVEFENCRAETVLNGGAVYALNLAPSAWTNVTFSNCLARGMGGAAFIELCDSLEIYNAQVLDNEADGHSGGLELDGSNVLFGGDYALFSGNSAGDNAGAVRVRFTTATFEASTVTFQDNTAANNAGGIMTSGLDAEVVWGSGIDVSFSGNEAGNQGSALRASGASILSGWSDVASMSIIGATSSPSDTIVSCSAGATGCTECVGCSNTPTAFECTHPGTPSGTGSCTTVNGCYVPDPVMYLSPSGNDNGGSNKCFDALAPCQTIDNLYNQLALACSDDDENNPVEISLSAGTHVAPTAQLAIPAVAVEIYGAGKAVTTLPLDGTFLEFGTGSSFSIHDLTISDGSNTGNGGCVRAFGVGTIDSVAFEHCVAANEGTSDTLAGGCLYSSSASNGTPGGGQVAFTNLDFLDCNVTGDGSAMYVVRTGSSGDMTPVPITDITATSCHAFENGTSDAGLGTISLHSTGPPFAVERLTVTDCSSTACPGLYYEASYVSADSATNYDNLHSMTDVNIIRPFTTSTDRDTASAIFLTSDYVLASKSTVNIDSPLFALGHVSIAEARVPRAPLTLVAGATLPGPTQATIEDFVVDDSVDVTRSGYLRTDAIDLIFKGSNLVGGKETEALPEDFVHIEGSAELRFEDGATLTFESYAPSSSSVFTIVGSGTGVFDASARDAVTIESGAEYPTLITGCSGACADCANTCSQCGFLNDCSSDVDGCAVTGPVTYYVDNELLNMGDCLTNGNPCDTIDEALALANACSLDVVIDVVGVSIPVGSSGLINTADNAILRGHSTGLDVEAGNGLQFVGYESLDINAQGDGSGVTAVQRRSGYTGTIELTDVTFNGLDIPIDVSGGPLIVDNAFFDDCGTTTSSESSFIIRADSGSLTDVTVSSTRSTSINGKGTIISFVDTDAEASIANSLTRVSISNANEGRVLEVVSTSGGDTVGTSSLVDVTVTDARGSAFISCDSATVSGLVASSSTGTQLEDLALQLLVASTAQLTGSNFTNLQADFDDALVEIQADGGAVIDDVVFEDCGGGDGTVVLDSFNSGSPIWTMSNTVITAPTSYSTLTGPALVVNTGSAVGIDSSNTFHLVEKTGSGNVPYYVVDCGATAVDCFKSVGCEAANNQRAMVAEDVGESCITPGHCVATGPGTIWVPVNDMDADNAACTNLTTEPFPSCQTVADAVAVAPTGCPDGTTLEFSVRSAVTETFAADWSRLDASSIIVSDGTLDLGGFNWDFSSQSDVTFDNLYVGGGSSNVAGLGGCVTGPNGTFSAYSSVINGCDAQAGPGGALYVPSYAIVYGNELSIASSHAAGPGGAMYIESHAQVTLENDSGMSSCTSDIGGALAYVEAGGDFRGDSRLITVDTTGNVGPRGDPLDWGQLPGLLSLGGDTEMVVCEDPIVPPFEVTDVSSTGNADLFAAGTYCLPVSSHDCIGGLRFGYGAVVEHLWLDSGFCVDAEGCLLTGPQLHISTERGQDGAECGGAWGTPCETLEEAWLNFQGVAGPSVCSSGLGVEFVIEAPASNPLYIPTTIAMTYMYGDIDMRSASDDEPAYVTLGPDASIQLSAMTGSSLTNLVIDGGASQRSVPMLTASGAFFTCESCVLRNALADGLVHPGISSTATTVTLSNSLIDSVQDVALGGSSLIASFGTVTLSNTTVTNSSRVSFEGAFSTANLVDGTVIENAPDGGLEVWAASATINIEAGVRIVNNYASDSNLGGGITSGASSIVWNIDVGAEISGNDGTSGLQVSCTASECLDCATCTGRCPVLATAVNACLDSDGCLGDASSKAYFVEAGGSDLTNDCESSVAPCATLGRVAEVMCLGDVSIEVMSATLLTEGAVTLNGGGAGDGAELNVELYPSAGVVGRLDVTSLRVEASSFMMHGFKLPSSSHVSVNTSVSLEIRDVVVDDEGSLGSTADIFALEVAGGTAALRDVVVSDAVMAAGASSVISLELGASAVSATVSNVSLESVDGYGAIILARDVDGAASSEVRVFVDDVSMTGGSDVTAFIDSDLSTVVSNVFVDTWSGGDFIKLTGLVATVDGGEFRNLQADDNLIRLGDESQSEVTVRNVMMENCQSPTGNGISLRGPTKVFEDVSLSGVSTQGAVVNFLVEGTTSISNANVVDCESSGTDMLSLDPFIGSSGDVVSINGLNVTGCKSFCSVVQIGGEVSGSENWTDVAVWDNESNDDAVLVVRATLSTDADILVWNNTRIGGSNPTAFSVDCVVTSVGCPRDVGFCDDGFAAIGRLALDFCRNEDYCVTTTLTDFYLGGVGASDGNVCTDPSTPCASFGEVYNQYRFASIACPTIHVSDGVFDIDFQAEMETHVTITGAGSGSTVLNFTDPGDGILFGEPGMQVYDLTIDGGSDARCLEMDNIIGPGIYPGDGPFTMRNVNLVGCEQGVSIFRNNINPIELTDVTMTASVDASSSSSYLYLESDSQITLTRVTVDGADKLSGIHVVTLEGEEAVLEDFEIFNWKAPVAVGRGLAFAALVVDELDSLLIDGGSFHDLEGMVGIIIVDVDEVEFRNEPRVYNVPDEDMIVLSGVSTVTGTMRAEGSSTGVLCEGSTESCQSCDGCSDLGYCSVGTPEAGVSIVDGCVCQDGSEFDEFGDCEEIEDSEDGETVEDDNAGDESDGSGGLSPAGVTVAVISLLVVIGGGVFAYVQLQAQGFIGGGDGGARRQVVPSNSQGSIATKASEAPGASTV